MLLLLLRVLICHVHATRRLPPIHAHLWLPCTHILVFITMDFIHQPFISFIRPSLTGPTLNFKKFSKKAQEIPLISSTSPIYEVIDHFQHFIIHIYFTQRIYISLQRSRLSTDGAEFGQGETFGNVSLHLTVSAHLSVNKYPGVRQLLWG